MTFEASTVRHELRTPVNHVIGYADLLLEEGNLPPALEVSLGEVKALARQVLTVISGILDADAAVSRASVTTLDGVVQALGIRVRALESDVAHEADVDRIRTGSARLAELVDALKWQQPDVPVATPGETTADESSADTRAPVVLVVDDDEANRNVLSRRLFRLGYRVVEAANGREALAVLAADSVDLVLLDVMMPELDGYQVLEQRRRSALLREIPVIMISALDQVESVVRCVELGADDYLAKPFDPVLLQARVGACLEKKRLRDGERALGETVSRQADELRAWNAELERRVEEKAREVERLSLIERFVPPQLAAVLQSGSAELLKSHRREITVLFADLRGFTPFAEQAEPEDVMTVLREFHNAVGPLIFEHEGTLAQFTGDGMMVFFNDPIPCPDPAARAVRLAVAMRESTASLSTRWRRRGHELALGVGIAIGHATCGEIGFEGRFEYTAIGTVTNLASRLCAEAAGGQVLVAGRIAHLLEGQVSCEHVGDLALKGIARPVPTFAVTAFADSLSTQAASPAE
jgi:adenylate cyclase